MFPSVYLPSHLADFKDFSFVVASFWKKSLIAIASTVCMHEGRVVIS